MVMEGRRVLGKYVSALYVASECLWIAWDFGYMTLAY
jgi:hypothetical protein